MSSGFFSGYPQPEDGYREIVYDLSEWCDKCGVGAIQRHEFSFSAEPRWGRRDVISTNWNYYEIFVRKSIWSELFKPLGFPCIPVLKHRSAKALETVVQLDLRHAPEAHFESARVKVVTCKKCKRSRCPPLQRGAYPPLAKEPSRGEFAQSAQWFGEGWAVGKVCLISQKAYAQLTVRGLRGAKFEAIEHASPALASQDPSQPEAGGSDTESGNTRKKTMPQTSMSKKELTRRLGSYGLKRVATDITALSRDCIRIRATVDDEKSIPVGSSKLGGKPDLFADIDWPVRIKKKLSFLAQIDLEEVAGLAATTGLPPIGFLWFFYDADSQPWGFDPADRAGWRVLYDRRPRSELIRRAPSAKTLSFPASSVEFCTALCMPSLKSSAVEELKLSDAEWDSYFDLQEDPSALFPDGYLHQLLGQPSPVQGEMQIECQLASNGIYCGDEMDLEAHPRSAALASRASDWRLLLQLESDDELNWQWGDEGRLYFWIKEQDLEAADFQNVWTVLQCH